MKTQKELKELLAKQVEEISLAADRDVTRTLQDLEAALTAVMLQMMRKYKNEANDPALKSLFGKSRKSIDDIVDYLISKKII